MRTGLPRRRSPRCLPLLVISSPLPLSWVLDRGTCSSTLAASLQRPCREPGARSDSETPGREFGSLRGRRKGAPWSFELLGPLQVLDEGRVLQLGGAKQRSTLAMLLLGRNQVVSRDQLIDGLWGASPPPSAGPTLETYVSRLRRVLPDDGDGARLLTQPPGYRLRVETGELDLERFETLLGQARTARAAGDPESAARRPPRGALAVPGRTPRGPGPRTLRRGRDRAPGRAAAECPRGAAGGGSGRRPPRRGGRRAGVTGGSSSVPRDPVGPADAGPLSVGAAGRGAARVRPGPADSDRGARRRSRAGAQATPPADPPAGSVPRAAPPVCAVADIDRGPAALARGRPRSRRAAERSSPAPPLRLLPARNAPARRPPSMDPSGRRGGGARHRRGGPAASSFRVSSERRRRRPHYIQARDGPDRPRERGRRSPPSPARGCAVAAYPIFAGGHFWVNNWSPNAYVEIDPKTGAILKEISPPARDPNVQRELLYRHALRRAGATPSGSTPRDDLVKMDIGLGREVDRFALDDLGEGAGVSGGRGRRRGFRVGEQERGPGADLPARSRHRQRPSTFGTTSLPYLNLAYRRRLAVGG